jgi:hydrogenase maturation protein HypF
VVQGVGFRPHVFRIAKQHHLTGWIRNATDGVTLEVQGAEASVLAFLDCLRTQPPPLATITAISDEEIPCAQEQDFSIEQSSAAGHAHTLISPDIATCPDCLHELLDPRDRRYGYPFLNCTNCGPRFTILHAIPYDRPNTSMQPFRMCPACQAEYDDPGNRRFHAQPNACWQCGPQLTLLDLDGNVIAGDPIQQSIERLRRGDIVAIQGLGGFHLAVDATQPEAVARLRERKHRWEKPLAIQVADADAAERFCTLSTEERALLESPQRPIVLLPRKDDVHGVDALSSPLAPQIAPGSPELGVFLPYTPVQHLLFHQGGFAALVMTSANRSEEPICISNAEALLRLRTIADCFLVHNREILLRCDDSIARHQRGRTTLLRRARGFTPMPVPLACDLPSVLAVGGELKNTICLTRGREAFLSQHIGDLENLAAYGFFEETTVHLQKILEIAPIAVACDLHPEYFSTRWAAQQPLPVHAVQHHHAHLASCMAENPVSGAAVGIVLDGTGYGTDGNLWGGEILLARGAEFERRAHLAYAPMPGGTQAILEPWRMAAGFLSLLPEPAYTQGLARLQSLYGVNTGAIRRMIELRLRSPLSSGCGRLFDAVAALIGLRSTIRFEAQAAIELEALCAQSTDQSAYPLEVLSDANAPLQISTAPLFAAILADLDHGCAPATISRRFHLGLARVFAETAAAIAQEEGGLPVCLTGGCLQNIFLADALEEELTQRGLRVFTQTRVPAGDGGLSLGQAWIAAQKISAGAKHEEAERTPQS